MIFKAPVLAIAFKWLPNLLVCRSSKRTGIVLLFSLLFHTQNQFKGSSFELPRRKEFSDIIFVKIMRLTSRVRFISTSECHLMV